MLIAKRCKKRQNEIFLLLCGNKISVSIFLDKTIILLLYKNDDRLSL